MGFFGNLFSKQACSICGKEVGALGRIKLKDKNYICRDCGKNASRLFRLGYHDLDAVKKHLAYTEKANELYEKEFATLDKDQVDYCGHHGSHKIGFADSIGMFEVVSPEMKKSNNRELFRYDQIDSFGPYYDLNSMSDSENEGKYKEYGVLIKMRCAEDFTQVNASEEEKALMHPYAIEIKIPIQHNVDNPSGGDRIYNHLAEIFGSSGAANAVGSVLSALFDSPAGMMVSSGEYSEANREKYTKLADEAEIRALGKPLRDLLS